jgi:protein-disulfide isomerase
MRAILLTFASAGIVMGQVPLIEGNPKSLVRVIVYEDLQCPDCADYRGMMDEKLLGRYAAKVAFEHRDFPLEKHKWARKGAVAARFFQEKNPALAIQFRQYAMKNLRLITPENFNDKLSEFAKSHAIDPAAALTALDDKKLADLVEQDYQEGVARGVSRTPTVFVNGEPFVERFSFEEISKAIDAALAGTKQ